jgi:hypothetical protein
LIALAVLFPGRGHAVECGAARHAPGSHAERLYTLSSGTQQVLGELKEPVNLYFLFLARLPRKGSAAGHALCHAGA